MNKRYDRRDMIEAVKKALTEEDREDITRREYTKWRKSKDQEYPSKSTILRRESWDTIRMLAQKELEQNQRQEIRSRELNDREETLLEQLKTEEYPLPRSDLIEGLEGTLNEEVSERKFDKTLEYLREEGYDIKKIRGIEDKYILVRDPNSPDQKFRPLNEFDTPLMLSSDWHIGSKQFSVQAFDAMLNDIDDYGIETVLNAGDILQGLGVHRQEAKDIKEPDIDSQVEDAMDLVRRIPADVHAIIGNHEAKLKGKHRVGFDALKYIANSCRNFTYYGSAASFMINDDHKLLMVHGSGGSSYALSYSTQKIYRNLSERPDIFLMGHIHSLQYNTKHGNHLITSGTMQRENSWLMNKGITTEVGYYILEDVGDEFISLTKRTPKVY